MRKTVLSDACMCMRTNEGVCTCTRVKHACKMQEHMFAGPKLSLLHENMSTSAPITKPQEIEHTDLRGEGKHEDTRVSVRYVAGGLRESASLAILPAGLVAFAPLFWQYHTQVRGIICIYMERLTVRGL